MLFRLFHFFTFYFLLYQLRTCYLVYLKVMFPQGKISTILSSYLRKQRTCADGQSFHSPLTCHASLSPVCSNCLCGMPA